MYSRLSGRELIIDWSDYTYSNDGSNVFHRFFSCRLCEPNVEIPDTYSVNPSIWRGNLRKSVNDMDKLHGNIANNIESRRIFSVDHAKLDYNEDVLVMWTPTNRIEQLRTHFNGKYKEFASLNTDSISSKLLTEDLVLHPTIRERVDQFMLKRFNRDTFGVHVRYTDKKLRLPEIQRKLYGLLKRIPDLQIFLSTDNLEIKKIFEQSYPSVVTTPHWYPTAGLTIHKNQSCPDRTESGIEALVDLYLLAECNYLIIDTGSSFSYIAKLLAKAHASCIFDVKPGEKPLRRLRNFSRRLRKLSLRFRIKLGSWPRRSSII